MTAVPDRATSRTYIVPVGPLDLPGDTHLALLSWNTRISEWLTSIAICGESAAQGELPDAPTVTCTECLEQRAVFETLLERKERPDVRVRPTRFEVSLLPPEHEGFRYFRVFVEVLDRCGRAVHDGHSCLGGDGQWDHAGKSVYGRDDTWIAAHRFDLETAKRLAIEAAPGINVNGMNAAQALARKEAP